MKKAGIETIYKKKRYQLQQFFIYCNPWLFNRRCRIKSLFFSVRYRHLKSSRMLPSHCHSGNLNHFKEFMVRLTLNSLHGKENLTHITCIHMLSFEFSCKVNCQLFYVLKCVTEERRGEKDTQPVLLRVRLEMKWLEKKSNDDCCWSGILPWTIASTGNIQVISLNCILFGICFSS